MFTQAILKYNELFKVCLQPKVVLFDMDGVLYDSMPNHAKAWVRAMKECGIKFTDADSYATEGAKGVDTVRKYAYDQLGKTLSEEEAEAMYQLKARYFHEMDEPKMFSGVKDLMRQIKDCGIKIGVVTGSGQRLLIQRLVNDFSEFITEQDVTTAFDVKRGKPNPDPYLRGLEKAGGFLPSEAIVVENAPLGIRAGVAAQCFTIAINSGPLADEVLLDEGANLLLPNIQTLATKWQQLLCDLRMIGT